MNRLLLLPFFLICVVLNAKSFPGTSHQTFEHPANVLADSLPPAINCPGNVSITLGSGTCDTIYNYSVVAYDNEPGFVLSQLSGISPGSPFPIGATVNSFLVTDAAGNTAGCSFTVIVNDHPATLVCKTSVAVGLGENCTAMPGWELFLENEIIGCPDNYFVQVDVTAPFGNGPWLPASLTLADKNKTYAYRVRTLSSNVSCSGTIVIKDLQGPVLTCTDVFIPCEVTPITPDFLLDSLGLDDAYPQVTDNCGIVADTSFLSSLHFVDEYDPVTKVLKYTTRTWSATDDSGNKSSCVQNIYQVKSNLPDVFFPADITFECSDTLVYTPAVAGLPYIVYQEHVFPLNACAMVYTNVDSIGVRCGQSIQVFRKWYLLDSETAAERNGMQLIDIEDVTPPAIACPTALTVTVDATACMGTVNLPDVQITDGCSGIDSIQAYWNQGDSIRFVRGTLMDFPDFELDPTVKLGILDNVMQFPVGTTLITYEAADVCGNKDTCQWTLTVLDMQAPTAVCDSLIEVVLGPDGKAVLDAGALDNASADACLPIVFKVKLLTPGACQSETGLTDNILLCCADQADTLTASLRVYDVEVPPGMVDDTFGAGHFADCTARIVVRDTLPELCDNLPDITVSCSEYDPTLAAYGSFPSSCAVDSSYIDVDYSLFDTTCHVGNITRVFYIVNGFGQTSYCFQQISVEPAVQHYYVRFPDDLTINACVAGADYGKPEIFKLPTGCELVDFEYSDVINTVIPNGCYRIQRTWVVLNLCYYNPSLPLTVVPNPQFATGPTVSEPGTTGQWAPTPAFENIWSANINGYQYTQTIVVVDQQVPVFESCNQELQVLKDSSNNDPQIWNEGYWLYPQTQINDLCEKGVTLSCSAKDLCSGNDVTLRYILSLDLDGDDFAETVVSSNNFPGYNTIRYNNYNTPNYGGGTVRQFDERPVSANAKWGFAIQTVQSDSQTTAYVRFNTLITPQQYVLPQLPYGKHKIRWIAEDPCGNEAACDYFFEIKDGKAPDVLCPDSITVYFDENPGLATLDLTDVLLSTTDNCTPTPLIDKALRISGQGTGYPEDIPVQSLYFNCTTDANTNKVVEVWVRDVADNARFCAVHVHVDSCDLEVPPVANHIVGSVLTETGMGVKDVTMLALLANNGVSISISDTTDVGGMYDINVDSLALNGVFSGGTAAVFPYKNTDPTNGVTTFDLLLISKHIIGLDTLDSPYKIIAADANRSGIVTSFDVVELRKLILGIYEDLPASTSWRFVQSDYVFPDPNYPFQPAFPESDTSYYYLNGGKFDFVGIKIGDVNQSVDPQNLDADIPERREQVLPVQTDQRDVLAGEIFTATFNTTQPSDGFQFTMAYEGLQLLDILPGKGMSAEQFAQFPGKNALTVACEQTEPTSFSLRFKALQAGALCDMISIGSQITPAAAWLPTAGKKVVPATVTLSFADSDGFALLQNQPNPFADKTVIRFLLPAASEATLQVFDSKGRSILKQTGWYEKGMNTVPLDLTGVPPGVLYYQLETTEHRAVQKMIRMY